MNYKDVIISKAKEHCHLERSEGTPLNKAKELCHLERSEGTPLNEVKELQQL